MKKIIVVATSLIALFAVAQIRQPVLAEKTNVIKIKPTVEMATHAAFSAYASYWAFNKPCNTNRLWLISAENILKKEGLQIFDPASNNNISVAGYNTDKRVLVTVICTAAPDGRTTLVLNVFSDDSNANKTMGELFRKKFQGVTMIDCG
jgi:hypothetical protein